MKINDKRKSSNPKRLEELTIGESFIYNNELYMNLDRSDMGSICVYNFTHDDIVGLIETTQVTPVKIEINIIE